MKRIILLISLLSVVYSNAQVNMQWAKGIGSSGSDIAAASVIDGTGNVYTAGYFNGTVDFDPGPGVFNMTSSGAEDVFICKLDASGNFLWAKQMGSSGSDEGWCIALDASNNIYTTGWYSNTVDFDPGPGTYNLSSIGYDDIFISKLDANGNFIWAQSIGGSTGYDRGYGIIAEAGGNVYLTGIFSGTVDFDPGVGVYNLLSNNSSNDAFVCKLNSSGNFLWAKQMGSSGTEYGWSIALDASNNVFTTGIFNNTVDFDPGPGTFNLSSNGGDDIFIQKLDASGNFVWAKSFGGSGSDFCCWITVDATGNVITTGQFQSTVDFDPGINLFNLTTIGINDIFVSKLNNSGNFLWAKNMGGTFANNGGYSTVTDAAGNIYTTGQFQAVVDFDPGPGSFNISSNGGSSDIYVQKLDPSGNFVWATGMGGPGTDYGNTIAINTSGNIYFAGVFQNSLDFDPGYGTYTLSSNGSDDIFIEKLCQMAAPVITPSGSLAICQGSNVILSVGAANSYSWSNGAVTQTILVNGAGDYSVITTNTAGCASTSSATTIYVNPLPTITVNSGTVCAGTSFTLVPSGANTYTYAVGGPVVSPTITSTYSVTGTSTAGCISAAPAVSTITVLASPSISVNSGGVCPGQSFTIIPSGANTYTIQGGNPVVSPTVNSTYTVIGTSTAGCVSQAAVTSTVVIYPNPTISVNSGSICLGNSFTINPSGAATYTFSGGSAIVSPTVTTSYSVTGTSSFGCAGINTVVSTVTVSALPLPTLVATSSQSLICVGETATLTASGANSYTWAQGGNSASISISPVVTTIYTVTGSNANGCSGTTTITQDVSPCTGIQENTFNILNGIYPNPNNAEFTIQSDADMQIDITDQLGRKITEIEVKAGSNNYTLHNLAKGVYLLSGKANGKVYKGKMVVQ